MSDRVSYATRDPEVAGEFLSRSFTDVSVLRTPEDAPFELANSRFDAGPFQLDEMRIAASGAFSYEPEEIYFASRVTRGRLRVRHGKVEERLGVGEVALIGIPRVPGTTEVEDYRQDVVTLGIETVREAAGLDPTSEELPTFTSIRPFSIAGARTWKATLDFVERTLLGDPAICDSPLVVGDVNRLLAGLLLNTFPNDAIVPPLARDGRDARETGTLHRAIAFIEANADRPIGIGEIADAANVSRRAVQLAFARHLEMTPTAYLRRIRLDSAHAELAAGSPDSGLTVTDVAYRWGFSSPSRFAERYRASYGRSPSETLRA